MSMTPLSWNSSQRSLPSRVRSPTPANTDTPPCFIAMLWISSWMMTVLPTPAPPNRPILPPLQVRLEQVDDLDAGLEHLQLGRLLLERRRGAVDRPALLSTAPAGRGSRPARRARSCTRPSVSRPDRHRDRRAGVDRLHAALQAVGRLHRDGADAVLAEVLLDLDDDVDGVAAVPSLGDAHGVVDRRQVPALELDVDDRSDDLDDPCRPSARLLCSRCRSRRPDLPLQRLRRPTRLR